MTTRTAQRQRARQARRDRPRTFAPHVPLAQAQRYVLTVLVAAGGVVMLTSSNDSFFIPKLTFLVVGVIVLLALSGLRAAVTGVVQIPRSGALIAVVALCAALVVATVISERPMLSIVGEYGRYAGLAGYLTYAALFFFVLRLYDERWLGNLARSVLVAATTVSFYGVLQILDADPVAWGSSGFKLVFGTFGNPNFAAGYMAVVTPITAWVALSSRFPMFWRYWATAATMVGLVFMWETDSFQGPAAAAAGLGLLLAVFGWQRLISRSQGARVSRRAMAVTGVCGMVALAAAPFAVRLALRELQEGEERVMFWRAAVDMFFDKPVLGHGLAMFSTQFPAYRPEEHALRWQLGTTDTAHNVPLSMFPHGGLLLGLAYLVFVGFIGWSLIRGLGRQRGEQQLLLAAFGGAWLAYQVQSLVSIDVPALAALHFVTAGAIVVLARPPELRTLRLFTSSTPVQSRRRGRSSGRSGLDIFIRRPAVTVVLLFAVIATTWFASRPLRADLAAGQARALRNSGQPAAAADELRDATDLAPWEGTYYTMLAGSLVAANRKEEALEAGRQAAELNTGKVIVALAAAQLAEELGRVDEAEKWFQDAIELDPYNPQVLLAAGQFYAVQGRPEDAMALLERVVAVRPDEARAWATLTELYEALGRLDDAERAHARAEALLRDDA